MVHTKKVLEKISHAQAVATLVFLLAWLRINHPKIYRKTERRLGLLARGKGQLGGRRRGKRPSRKQLAARRRFAAMAKRHHGKVPKKRSR